MKIAILGTRGIPNHYGGFEQYAELLSTYMVAHGWDVTVYNSHKHPYQKGEFKGVKLIHIYDPEYKVGTVGQFVYDLNCIRHIRKCNYDIVYQLGYTSSAIFNFLLPKRSKIVTNMDGLEWMRSKYSRYIQKFLKYSERIAVKHADALVADSLGIKDYLDKKYRLDVFYSAYTAVIPMTYNQSILSKYELQNEQYNLLIARLEPENNIEMICSAYQHSNCTLPLIVIGNHKTDFGNYLKQKFKNNLHIRFIGAVYDKDEVNALRHFSKYYFHGHSVGGTNPSLLEAMACECRIIAHKNIFNSTVLGEDALYFDSVDMLKEVLIKSNSSDGWFTQAKENNLTKVKNVYSEDYVFGGIVRYMKTLL